MAVRIGVRNLKARLSAYLRRVKEGETIAITERNKVVGMIVPPLPSLAGRLESFVRSGSARWSGKRWRPPEVLARPRGKRTVADLLIEARR